MATGLEAVSFSGVGNINLTAIVSVIFTALITGVMLIFLYVMLQYNIRVEIHSRRAGGNVKIIKDYAKITTSSGVKKLRLFKRKREIPVPPREFFYVLSGKKEKIFFFEDVSGRVHPAKMRFGQGEEMFLQPEYEEEKDWFVREREKNEERHRKMSFFEKYQYLIITGAMIGFVLVVVLFSLQKYEKVSEHFAGLIGAVQTYCTGTVLPATP